MILLKLMDCLWWSWSLFPCVCTFEESEMHLNS